jgi:hypothetical protein
LWRNLLAFLVPPNGGPDAVEIQALTHQFYRTLRASFLRIPAPPPEDAVASGIYGEAHDLILRGAQVPSWDDNYQIEQLLVDLHAPAVLHEELSVRSQEAKRVLGTELAVWYEQRASAVTDEGGRRALLGRLVNDLQWRYKIREAQRGYVQAISTDAAIAFVTLLVPFATLLALSIRATIGDLSGKMMLVYALVAAAGAWGASFSMLLNQRKRLEESSLDDLKQLRKRVVLFSRLLVGLGASIVFVVFLSSGLLDGDAFPELSTWDPAKPTEDPGFLGGKDLALLVFWAFLAGFSERLVPSLLARTESRVVDESSAASAAAHSSPGDRPGSPSGGQASGKIGWSDLP